MSEAFIVQPSEGRRLDLGGFEAVVLATSAQTPGDFSLLRTQNEPTGFSPPLHVHRDAAEAFYVLEGDYLVHIEDRQQLSRRALSCMSRKTCMAESPGARAAEDASARWAGIQRRMDDLARELYALLETAPGEAERERVADVLASLQAVRSAMDAERAPGGLVQNNVRGCTTCC